MCSRAAGATPLGDHFLGLAVCQSGGGARAIFVGRGSFKMTRVTRLYTTEDLRVKAIFSSVGRRIRQRIMGPTCYLPYTSLHDAIQRQACLFPRPLPAPISLTRARHGRMIDRVRPH